MKVMVLNCGSSSVKGAILQMPEAEVLADFSVKNLGNQTSGLQINKAGERVYSEQEPFLDHEKGIRKLLEYLFSGAHKVLEKWELQAIGHRVVQGGEKYRDSAIVTPKVVEYLLSISDIAPLHNPNHVAGMKACEKLLPDILQIAVFDNGYHKDLPRAAYTYGIPHEYSENEGIRKYGFHGIAFRSMLAEAKKLLHEDLKDRKIILLMLGSGTTANAVINGKSKEVSTGFTPLEGLIQSTRSGDVDPAVATYLMRKKGMTHQEVDDLLNKKSGWYGMSAISSDLKEITEAAENGDERALCTIDAVSHRIKKYIGGYSAVLGGVDLLVFGGGVGENAPTVREKICDNLSFLGIELDEDANRSGKSARRIGKREARAQVLVVPVDEEKVIAGDVYAIVSQMR
ncbi:MAG TPA: acetate kinase [Eubacteriaceae bacterium]|nr:acetate kinase [Eubacteriaceae bacterium]